MSHAQKQRNRLKGKRLYEGWIQQVRAAGAAERPVTPEDFMSRRESPAWLNRSECRRWYYARRLRPVEENEVKFRRGVDDFAEHINHCRGCKTRYHSLLSEMAAEPIEAQIRHALCSKGYQALRRQRAARELQQVEDALERS